MSLSYASSLFQRDDSLTSHSTPHTPIPYIKGASANLVLVSIHAPQLRRALQPFFLPLVGAQAVPGLPEGQPVDDAAGPVAHPVLAPAPAAGGQGFVRPVAGSLPHVRGGVSIMSAAPAYAFKSSPRAWGCFHLRRDQRSNPGVFPTCVGHTTQPFSRLGASFFTPKIYTEPSSFMGKARGRPLHGKSHKTPPAPTLSQWSQKPHAEIVQGITLKVRILRIIDLTVMRIMRIKIS